MKSLTEKGSVRVDLLGGTLDIHPINIILNNVHTINVATSLQANVTLTESSVNGLEIQSHDYETSEFFAQPELNKLGTNEFCDWGPFEYMLRIFLFFGITEKVKCELSSGSPPGAGLGGSSAMGITLFKALAKWTNQSFSQEQSIGIVKNIEAMILDNGPTGYQDYYPALVGGILDLKASFSGVQVRQLYKPELDHYLREHLLLINSKESRNSGINNWQVFKAFFDNRKKVRPGLEAINNLSQKAIKAIETQDYEELIRLIGEEGEEREKLFSGIVTDKVKKLIDELKNEDLFRGFKICGAGGGGCFLLTIFPKQREKILSLVKQYQMEDLDFSIVPPADK